MVSAIELKKFINQIVASREDIFLKDVFSIHGIFVSIGTNKPLISKVLRKFLNYFYCDYCDFKARSSDISFFFLSLKENFLLPELSSDTELLSWGKSTRCFRPKKGKVLILEVKDKGLIFLDLEEPIMWAFVKEDFVKEELHPSARLLTHTLFYPFFQERLKRFGLFHIHAACLAREDQGILIAGKSGSGKSTLALSLLREGFSFLSDDITFAQRKEGEIKLLAFPQGISLSSDTLDYFPELKFLKNLSPVTPGKKISLSIEEIQQSYYQRITESCHPKVIIFPQIEKGKSSLKPVAPAQALAEILCYSLLLLDEETSKEHLKILKNLVDTCNCFELKVGRDRENIPSLLEKSLYST